MSSKVAELKQCLSFRSLRLMEWKDSQSFKVRSFSDSETIDRNSLVISKEIQKSISKSETNLKALTIRDGKDHLDYKTWKTSLDSDSLIFKAKKSEICRELKSSNSDFNINLSQSTLLPKGEAQIFNDISNSEKLICKTILELSRLNTQSTSCETVPPIIAAEGIPNTNHKKVKMSLENTSVYPVLESEQNPTSKTELIGEPRCLTLKKNDINPFLSDDPLIFEPDFEDDNKSFNKNPTLPKTVDRKQDQFVKDMFIDEDENATKKKGLLIDREDGELTPETPLKSSDLNKNKEPSSSEKKATLEFFNKINECLRDLNDKCREFYSSSTPNYSLSHLQRTMGNVDNIKRKLVFLIKSKNCEKEEKDKEKKVARKSHSNMRLHSERLATSSSTVDENKQTQDKQAHFSGLKNDVEELYRQLKENREKRSSENVSRRGHRRERRNRDKPSQADLLNRKKISILEKLGTKQEIERVQSLFKRQMNLITQHVIQKKEIDKKHVSKQEETQRRRRRRYSSQSQDEQEFKKSHDKVSLNDLKTLKDMEAFLDSLKRDKMLCEQYMNDQKLKGTLKFSSKKNKSIIPDVSSNIPAGTSVKASNDSKETFKQPLSKDNKDAVITKPNTSREENPQMKDAKQKVEDIKIKNAKIIPTILASETLRSRENDNHSKQQDTSDPNHDSRLKILLSKRTEQKTPDNSLNETQNQNKTHGDLDSKFKTSGWNKEEIEIKERPEPFHKSHKLQSNPEKSKHEDSKRKREDIPESPFNKSEIENEEKSSKKQKVTKYLAARRLSNENQSKTEQTSRVENKNVGTAESLVKDLLSRKVVILDDNGVAVNNEFCIKVIDNQVFLKKVSNKRRRKHSGRASKPSNLKNIKKNKKDQLTHEEKIVEVKPKLEQKRTEPKLGEKQTEPKLSEKQIEPKLDQEIIEPEIDPETLDTTLNEMENFLQDLRSKSKLRDDEIHHPIEHTSQNRETKFLARIQAKRKAKLMACVSDGAYSTEKEAKFLKALEKRKEDVSESSDVETRKQAFLEKIRAEKDAIAEKPKAKQNDDDPLKEVKAFLDMIKEAEARNEENTKQVYVSFSLKRSDVKKLENLTPASLLTEESQKLLNTVRSKIKAKKAPASGISALMKKPPQI